MFNGKTHYKLPFSIAMLVYQRLSQFLSMILPLNHPLPGDFPAMDSHDWMGYSIWESRPKIKRVVQDILSIRPGQRANITNWKDPPCY